MSPAAGTRLGSNAIEAPLGAGVGVVHAQP